MQLSFHELVVQSVQHHEDFLTTIVNTFYILTTVKHVNSTGQYPGRTKQSCTGKLEVDIFRIYEIVKGLGSRQKLFHPLKLTEREGKVKYQSTKQKFKQAALVAAVLVLVYSLEKIQNLFYGNCLNLSRK